MDFSKWAFQNSKLVVFIVVVLLLGGAVSAYDMSKLEDPEIKVKTAMVVTIYPGASAHQVELEVTDVIEKGISAMGDVSNITSYSYNDMSLIQVELESTVDNDLVEQKWDILRRRVDAAAASLPSGANRPVVQDDFGNVYGMFYALTGDGLSDVELSKYAELIKREVSNIEQVNRVELYGKRDECININLLQDKMANLGVMPMEVLSTLNNQNETTYTGYFDNGDSRVRVSVSDKFRNIDDIGAMLIQGHDDDQLRLRDIAQIELAYETPNRNELLYDQQHAIGILIAVTSGSDIIKIGKQIEQIIEQLEESRLPAGVEVHKVFFQSDRVNTALTTFMINLIESVLIVVVVLMIFMGVKSGMIIGASLVVTVFGTFLILSFFDGTLQRVSLGAFILAMGMLVDNAIVIIDGILVDLKAGKNRMEAMTSIGRQTAMPLLGATLIASLAFLPIFLSPDTTGYYIRDLFLVLTFALILSWILALIHVPLMANRYLNPKVESQQGERVYSGAFYGVLQKILRLGLAHRWTTVFVMLALLGLSGFGFMFMKQGFFPDMEYDQLYMEYKLPEGENSTRVRRDLAQIEAYLKTRPEITHVTTSIGGTPGRYNLVRSIANPSLAYGELIVDFTSPETLQENIYEIQDTMAALFPDAYVKFKNYNLMYKKYPIEVQFLGPDPAVLHRLADSARAIINRIPEAYIVTTDWEPKIPVLSVKYDQPAARSIGLSRSDVSLSLLTATSGIPIGSFFEGTENRAIYLRSLSSDGSQVEDLGSTPIFSQLPSVSSLLSEETLMHLRSGNFDKNQLIEDIMGTTPLRQVCTSIDVEWEDPVVPRYDGQRSQRVQCSPTPGVETEKARQLIEDEINKLDIPEGYTVDWQGEHSASSQSMKYLFKNFPLAIILMIAILIMLFKDYRKPCIIFCCIPFIIIGVVIVMLITGKTFNFVAIVGVLGLIGMLIKNGIVLMDEIGLQLGRGVEPTKAMSDSAQSRLMPVMMASLTTILGMIPLLPDAMFGSLAASIMGGLLFASIITLLFIPVLYALFFKIKLPKK